MQPSIALKMFQPTKRMMAIPVRGHTLQLKLRETDHVAFAEGGAERYVIRFLSRRQTLVPKHRLFNWHMERS
jgi:hypothetical protein